jgi:hypothetical protein
MLFWRTVTWLALMAAVAAARAGEAETKPRWIGIGVVFCPVADKSSPQCAFLETHDQFTTVRSYRGARGESYALITLKDGRSGYVREKDLDESAQDSDPMGPAVSAVAADAHVRECAKHGAPRIGMSSKQLTATCWGKPDTVNRTQTAGAVFDQYVYGDDRYVYLTNGVVTSIQTSGGLR